jgi:hypothetical protein
MAKSELSFRPHALPLDAYVGLTFGVVLFALGVAGLVFAEHGIVEILAAAFALLFGGYVLASGAYALWGRLRIAVDDEDWCEITWRLGRFSRSKRFPRPDVRNVHILPADPKTMFPSSTGRKVMVEVERERRPLHLGGGFDLDEDDLQAIVKLLAVPPSATEANPHG